MKIVQHRYNNTCRKPEILFITIIPILSDFSNRSKEYMKHSSSFLSFFSVCTGRDKLFIYNLESIISIGSEKKRFDS